MSVPLAAIGLGMGLIGSVGKALGRNKANKQLNKLLAENPEYKSNPLATQRLDYARQLLNARMPGSVYAERNILGNQANKIANISKNATDASQLLSLAGSIGNQTDDAFANLNNMENEDYYNRLGVMNQAQEGVIREGDKVFQDQTRRFQDKVQIRGAQNENRQNTWGDVGNFGFGLMNYGLAGGKLFNKKPPTKKTFNNPFSTSGRLDTTQSGTLNIGQRLLTPIQLPQRPPIVDIRNVGQPPNWRYGG